MFTGRRETQKPLIISYLQRKNYKFARFYFNQTSITSVLDESTFLIKYWTAKVGLVNQLRLTNDYKSIIVVDDDEIICSMLEKLNFRLYRAEITKDIPSQTLSITFNPPQKRLMSELQSLLEPPRKQSERLTETV